MTSTKFGSITVWHYTEEDNNPTPVEISCPAMEFKTIEDAENHMCDFMEAIKKARELAKDPV